MSLQVAAAKQSEIDQLVDEAKDELHPYVHHIKAELSSDWTGDPAVFFRIVLTNTAARGRSRFKIIERIRQHLREKIKPEALGLLAYFNFRSQSEQAQLRDKSWL